MLGRLRTPVNFFRNLGADKTMAKPTTFLTCLRWPCGCVARIYFRHFSTSLSAWRRR